jgi:hypothetical protein
VTNEASEACPAFYIQLEFARYGRPLETPWRFHSAWRRVMPAYRRGAPLALIEARGEGRVIGVIYHICKRDSDDRWSHGGGDHVFVDGDTPDPAYLYGMGGEDFAHHAWGLAPAQGPYSGAHMVHPVPTVKRAEGPLPFEPHGWEQHDGGRYSMYRFFIPDPIQFRRSIRFCFGTCANEISATSYWYQGEPHSPFCVLPPPDRRAYGTRLSDEECWRPLDMGRDIPVAVIGPFHAAGGRVPDLTRPVDLGATHMTDVRPPFADVVPPASEVRWRRSAIRGGFLDLAAIHRPKAAVRSRGVWNRRHVPLGVASVQLVRVQTALARRVRLRVGFEDGLAVWLNRRRVADLRRPEPAVWDLADVEIALDAGWNEIALVCTQERMARWSAWGIYAKLLDGDGRPADDLAFDDFAGLDPTPERWREPAPVEAETEAEDYRDPLFLV